MFSAVTTVLRFIGKRFMLLAALAATVTVAYLSIKHDPTLALKTYLENQIHPALFLLFMFLLPPLGVPVSLFLVLVGIKFGIVPGLGIAAAAMLVHMLFTYWVVHCIFGHRITVFLAKLRISIPTLLPTSTSKWPAFIFMLIPGPPYALKNIVLALSDLNFLAYLVINWTAQFSMSIPLIIVGRAVLEMNPVILGIALALFIVFYLLQRYIKKTYFPLRRSVWRSGNPDKQP